MLTILEALRQTIESLKDWIEERFLKKDEVSADDFGIYVQATEPTNVKDGDIWIDTALKIRKNGQWVEVCGVSGDASGATLKEAYITIRANAWTGSDNMFYQTVTCEGVDVNSKVDLQLTPEQFETLCDEEVSLMASNNNGIVTIYSFYGKPKNDMTIQAIITNVEVIS